MWQPDLTARHHGRERIEHVARVPMPAALRNELITEAYGDLADAMLGILGPADATWCVFGQWASHAVGDVLRLPGGSVGRLIATAFGDGNRLVFSDVGRAHSIFLETVGTAAATGGDLDAAWERCVRRLTVRQIEAPEPTPGPPSQAPANHDPTAMRAATRTAASPSPTEHPNTIRDLLTDADRGADPSHCSLLVRGFQAYRDAIGEVDPERRSRAILLGNALIAVHEQQRLAGQISVGFRSWLRHLTTLHRPMETRYRWRNRDPGRWRLSLEDRWILFATGRLVGIDLPDKRLDVGKPLASSGAAVEIPPGDPFVDDGSVPLDAIANDTLLRFVFDTFAVDGRPAACWADLSDRMAFILAMFASEQRSRSLITAGGVLRRPIPRPELAAQLDRFEARLVEHDRARPQPPSPAAVLSCEQLDALRAQPTHHFADRLAGLSFDQVGEQRVAPGPGRSDTARSSPAQTDTSHSDTGVTPADRVEALAEIDAEFSRRIETLSGPNGLLDPETIDSALAFFERWDSMVFMGLLFRSLPDGYAAADGVKVLGTISDLATDPVRRVGETAHFLRDLFATTESWEGSGEGRRLAADGPAARSIAGVRLMHALVARTLLDDDWDAERHGAPINAEDLLGTALSFVVPVFEMIDDLGIEVSGEERRAYTAMWCGIGHLLGLPLEAVSVAVGDGSRRRALTEHEARRLAQRIRRRHHERSLDGVRLTEALVAGVADGFPRFFDWIGPGLFQAVGNPEVNRLLLVTERRGHIRSEFVATILSALLRHRRTKVVARQLVRVAGAHWLAPFLAAGHHRPFRRPLESAERGELRPEPLVLDTRYWPLGLSSGASSGSSNEPIRAATRSTVSGFGATVG